MLLAELASELHLQDTSSSNSANSAGVRNKVAKTEEEREKEMLFNLIQTCVLLKLLGAGTDSGRLRISELGALLEDAWVLSVPNNGIRVSSVLSQLRFSLLQQVRLPYIFLYL